MDPCRHQNAKGAARKFEESNHRFQVSHNKFHNIRIKNKSII